MGIKTESFIDRLPPKEPTEGIEWMRILDYFDPSVADEKTINECARRNPYDTCYGWEKDGIPSMPIEERLKHSESGFRFDKRDLMDCIKRIVLEGATPVAYKKARAALIKAIGSKGALEYNRREYDRLGEEGRRKQAEEYAAWERDKERRLKDDEAEFEFAAEYGGYYYEVHASMHEKVIKVRKGVLCSNGKPMTQRDFAKYIGYPINKYVEAEKIDRYGKNTEPESEVEFELLEKLIMICHANPYWLFDDECEADYAEYDMEIDAVKMGDVACVFTTPDVILRWIEAGKPQDTAWVDGCNESD